MNPQQKTSLLLLALLGTIAFPLAGMLQGRHAAAIKAWAQPALAQEAPQPEPTFTPPATLATGTTLNIDGSTNMRVINQALAQGFEERYPGSDVVLSSNGVEAALQALLQGNLNLAAVGRPLSDQERSQGLTQVPISREKIAIIVGRDNSFQGDLSFDQFAQIFRGEITNWAQLKGPNLPIRFIDRPAGSDTRQALSGYEIFEGAPFETGANAITLETDDTAAVVRELGRDGISYAISSQVLDQDNVRVLTMDGTLPDDSRYPYSQPRGYVYRGEPSLAVEAFLGYATNPNGQQAVAEAKADEAATVATADLLPGQLAVSPDGQTIVRGTQDGLLEWYDDQGNSQGITVPAHTSLVTGIAFAPDGQSLLSSGADGSLRRWDLQGNPLGAPLQEDGDPITALAFSPNGQRIASGSNNGSVQLWSADGLPQGEPIQAHQGAVRGVAFSADSQTLITGSTDGAVRLWNPDGTPAGEVANVSASGITTLAASPNGQFLASGGADGTLQLFNAAGAPQGDSIAAHTDAITALAISPDGQTIASAGRDNTLRLWDPSGNAKTAADSTLPSPASALAYKPDGELVTGFADSTLQLRDPQGRLRIGELPGLPEDSNLNLPPGIANALQALPRSTWWIIPAIPILLILIGLLWSLFSGRKASVDDDLEDDFEESTPAADSSTAINGAPAVVTGAPIDGSYPPAGEVPPESAWVAAAPAADSGSSLGDKLGQAKVDLAEGTRLFREGRYDEALNRFNNSIEGAEVERMKAIAAGASLGGITLVLAPATARRGSVLALLGRPDRALESFNRALEMDPNSVEAWTGKGRLLASTGQLDEALFCFDKALELDATNGSAWAAKGQALLQMGRQQEGQDCLSRAAELGADELAPVTPPDLTVSPAGDIPEGYVPEGFAPEEYRNEYGVEYVPPVRDIPEGYVPEGFAPEAYPENERLRESMPSGDAPLPGPVSEAAPPALSGGVPTELSQLAAGLPSTETVTHSGTVLAEPEVPAHMQQVVEDLPDDPEMPEHAFITSAQITNPDDLDQPVAPIIIEAPTSPAEAAIAPVAATPPTPNPISIALLPEEASLPAPEELEEMAEALRATIDLSAVQAAPLAAAPSAPLAATPPTPISNPAADAPQAEPVIGSTPETARFDASSTLNHIPTPGEPLESLEQALRASGSSSTRPDNPDQGAESGSTIAEVARPDNPDQGSYAGDEFADLPPEVIAALRGIPTNSPDYIEVPSAPQTAAPAPPPVPANPRLVSVPKDSETLPRSWIKLSAQEDERLYVVWELSEWERTAAKQQGGESLAIRLYEIGDRPADSTPAGPLPAPVDEQECYELARDWYLTPPSPQAADPAASQTAEGAETNPQEPPQTYLVEIGYRTASGSWLSLARSNRLSINP